MKSVTLKGLLLLLAACALPLHGASLVKESVVTIESRERVQQSFILVEPPEPPRFAVVMLPGGPGLLRIRKEGTVIKLNEAGFMQRSRKQFAENGIAVAIADTPSDQQELWRPFRMTEQHARDIGAIIDNLHTNYGNIPVYLIGISRGGLSVAYVAKYLQEKVTGIVPMSALYKDSRGDSLEFFDWKQLKQRVLIVGHRNDGCRNTQFHESAYVAKEYHFPLLAASGGHEDLSKSARGECGPWAHHNFLGIEKPVAQEIINWILGKPFKTEISE